MYRAFRICFGVLAYACLASCGHGNDHQLPPVKSKAASAAHSRIIPKPGSGFQDTLVVRIKSAVFYQPDSQQMEKIRAVNQQNIFEMLVHDCHYQMLNARTELRLHWPSIRIIDAAHVRYVRFVKSSGISVCVDLDAKNDICGVLLFDTKKDPVMADMPNIDTVLNYYFGG